MHVLLSSVEVGGKKGNQAMHRLISCDASPLAPQKSGLLYFAHVFHRYSIIGRSRMFLKARACQKDLYKGKETQLEGENIGRN